MQISAVLCDLSLRDCMAISYRCTADPEHFGSATQSINGRFWTESTHLAVPRRAGPNTVSKSAASALIELSEF